MAYQQHLEGFYQFSVQTLWPNFSAIFYFNAKNKRTLRKRRGKPFLLSLVAFVLCATNWGGGTQRLPHTLANAGRRCPEKKAWRRCSEKKTLPVAVRS